MRWRQQARPKGGQRGRSALGLKWPGVRRTWKGCQWWSDAKHVGRGLFDRAHQRILRQNFSRLDPVEPLRKLPGHHGARNEWPNAFESHIKIFSERLLRHAWRRPDVGPELRVSWQDSIADTPERPDAEVDRRPRLTKGMLRGAELQLAPKLDQDAGHRLYGIDRCKLIGNRRVRLGSLDDHPKT